MAAFCALAAFSSADSPVEEEYPSMQWGAPRKRLRLKILHKNKTFSIVGLFDRIPLIIITFVSENGADLNPKENLKYIFECIKMPK